MTPRVRSQTTIRSPRNNDRVLMPSEANLPDRNSREFAQAQLNAYQAGGMSGSSPEKRGFCNANGSVHLTDRFVEFGSIGNLQLGPYSSSESSRQLDSGSPLVQSSNNCLPMPEMQRSKPVIGMDQERYENFDKSCVNFILLAVFMYRHSFVNIGLRLSHTI